MPRKGMVKRRDVEPDPRYNSKLVAKFINCIMRCGKKSVAQRILYDAFDICFPTRFIKGDVILVSLNSYIPCRKR